MMNITSFFTKLEVVTTIVLLFVGEMSWYFDARRFGACPQASFYIGFERLVLFVTGMTNIRDVILFPRTPNNCEF